MTALVRAASLHGYEALATACGVDVARALKRVGLTPLALSDPDALISYAARINLLEYTAQAGGDPAFGLHLSRVQDIGVFGAMAVLIRHAATVSEALALASRHLFFHNSVVRLDARPVAGQPRLVDAVFTVDMPHRPPCAQTIELSLGLIMQGLRTLGQGDIRPHLALFPHRQLGGLADYREVFGCECRFEAPYAAIRIAAKDLQRTVSEHNPVLQKLAENYLRANFGAPDQLVSDRVRAILRRFLGEGHASHSDIAQALFIHPRTMQRRLRDEGHAFEDILESVRRERLQELMAHSRAMSLSQMASVLGYSEQSTLTRSCKRWFGRTPSQLLQAASSRAS